jgi:hypothetical protein
MQTRLKLLALACAAPLALAACDRAQEDQQVGQVEDPAAPPPAATDTTEPERQAAEMPADQTAEAPPAAGDPGAPPEQDMAQAPQQDMEAAPAGEAPIDFVGNWAMQGEGCPGDWEFTQQTVEAPDGTFQVQDVQESGQEVELEVASMEGEQTETLSLSFPDGQQDMMVVRNGGDEITLERCQ